MKEELASHTAEHIRNIIQGCLETLVEEARKEVLEEVKKWAKKKLKYEEDSGVYADAGREDAFEEVVKFLSNL